MYNFVFVSGYRVFDSRKRNLRFFVKYTTERTFLICFFKERKLVVCVHSRTYRTGRFFVLGESRPPPLPWLGSPLFFTFPSGR